MILCFLPFIACPLLLNTIVTANRQHTKLVLRNILALLTLATAVRFVLYHICAMPGQIVETFEVKQWLFCIQRLHVSSNPSHVRVHAFTAFDVLKQFTQKCHTQELSHLNNRQRGVLVQFGPKSADVEF